MSKLAIIGGYALADEYSKEFFGKNATTMLKDAPRDIARYSGD